MQSLQSIRQAEQQNQQPPQNKLINPYKFQTVYSFTSLETALMTNFHIVAEQLFKNASLIKILSDRISSIERKQLMTPKQSKIQTISYQHNSSSLLEQKYYNKSQNVTNNPNSIINPINNIQNNRSSGQDQEQIQLTLSKDDYESQITKTIPQKILPTTNIQDQNSQNYNKEGTEIQSNARQILKKQQYKNNENSILQVISAISTSELSKGIPTTQKDTNSVTSLIAEKILEITQRLTNLEYNYTSLLSNNTKKFKQISSQVIGYHQQIKQQTKNIRSYENDVDKLRGQLSQYKIKKQGQFMRMLSKLDKQDKQGVGTYFIEKLQIMSKNIGQLVHTDKYNEDMIELNIHLQSVKNSLNKYASVEELQTSLMMINKKIQLATKNRDWKKNITQNQQNPQNMTQNSENYLISQTLINSQKINELSSFIQKLGQQIKQAKQYRRNYTQNLQKKITLLNQDKDKIHFKLQNHENFLKDMSNNYNEKIAQATTNIIDVQEQLEKLSAQIKFYQHTSRSDTNASLTPHNTSVQLGTPRNPEIQNQLQNLKKKLNKLNLKTTSLKQQITQIGSSITNRLAEFKIIVEDKADWQTLKKGMHFYEEKLKQMIAMLKSLNTNIDEQSKDQSIISKKRWTCLCCDKEVKAQQGKLQQLKFMSIYPSKYESPRIGGYYKQNMSDRDYKAIFLPNKRKIARSTGKQIEQASQLFNKYP